MYRHNSLDASVEVTSLESLFQIYRNQPGLPIVAVNQIRSEINHRQDRQGCFTEKSILLYLKQCIIAVRLESTEEAFVIDKIVFHTFHFGFHDSHIFFLPVEIHIKMCLIRELILHLLLHTGIFRKNHSDVKVFSVDTLGQRTDHIRQPTCLDKRNPFRCNKQNIFHTNPPKYKLSCPLQSLTYIIQHFQ